MKRIIQDLSFHWVLACLELASDDTVAEGDGQCLLGNIGGVSNHGDTTA